MGSYSPPRPKWGAKRGVIKPPIYRLVKKVVKMAKSGKFCT